VTTKKTKTTEAQRTHEEGEFGTIEWRAQLEGSALHHNWHDPFEVMLRRLNQATSTPAYIKDSAIHVHDTLLLAQSIAVSLFGWDWKEHVMDVYDRIQKHLYQRE